MFTLASYVGVLLVLAGRIARANPKATAAFIVALIVIGVFGSVTKVNIFTSPDRMFGAAPSAAPKPTQRVGCTFLEDDYAMKPCPAGVPNGSTVLYTSGGKVFYREPSP